MITRFATVYPGHIDLPDMGQLATPANERRFSNEQLAGVFEKTEAVATRMDELGYHAIWLAEHHFQHEGYECLPNVLMAAVHLAHLTRQIRIGCGFNIAPMWHPLRLAEDFATADILTRGRVIFGVGRGYHTREVETFGAPMLDADANRELFEEQVELMLQCFNAESFSHKGKHYEVPPPVEYRGYQMREVTCVPRPKHLPVDIWMPIASSKSIDYMASKNFKAMVTLNGEKILDDVVKAYRDACAKYGRQKQLGQDMIWGAGLYLADTPQEAARRVEDAHDERYKWFAPFGFVRYADEQGRTWGTPGAPARTPNLADGIAQKAWFCGPPKHVIDGIRSIEAKYPGLEDFMIHWAEGLGPKEFKEQLRWFARDVMPAFA
jgi:alkanesulfonate monooxygenase SsuD/methylene tetrahydromethanopterin reductase-like flavin-dependent oxidoreductase (luciferase family)